MNGTKGDILFYVSYNEFRDVVELYYYTVLNAENSPFTKSGQLSGVRLDFQSPTVRRVLFNLTLSDFYFSPWTSCRTHSERCIAVVHVRVQIVIFFLLALPKYGDRLRFNSLRHNHISFEEAKTGTLLSRRRH